MALTWAFVLRSSFRTPKDMDFNHGFQRTMVTSTRRSTMPIPNTVLLPVVLLVPSMDASTVLIASISRYVGMSLRVAGGVRILFLSARVVWSPL